MRNLIALASALLCVLSPAAASARTFSGSITVTAPSTAPAYGSVSVTASVSITETCDPNYGSPTYEYCGFFPVVETIPANQPCSRAASGGWVGPVFDSTTGPGTHVLAPYWNEYPSLQSGPKTACLYATGSIGDVLIAQATYTVPAPAATPAPVVPAPTRDYDCSDFRYQQDAQAYLLAGDPYRLDADHDGIACEELPSRPAVTPPATTAPAVYLEYAEAVQVARGALSKRFGRTWKDGRGRAVSCRTRWSPTAMVCSATWKRRGYRYKATVVIREYRSAYGTSARLISKRRA